MDEPLSNLDAKLRIQMRAELSQIHKRIGTTIIYVTHDQTEAMTMGERIVLMKGGVIQQQGAPMDLYDNPVSSYVAGFIGSPSMNLLDCELHVSGGDAYVDLGKGFTLPISAERFNGLDRATGKEVILGIRPEDIEDAEFVSVPDKSLQIRATADVVEPMGSETMLYLTAEDGRQITAKVDPKTKATFDRQVILQVDKSKFHLFDKATGASLR